METTTRKIHSQSAPIKKYEPVLLDWVTPTGLIKKPKANKTQDFVVGVYAANQ